MQNSLIYQYTTMTGKYIKLLYDPTFRLVGARTQHFLLEKSRLVHLEEGERTYHILYQVRLSAPSTLSRFDASPSPLPEVTRIDCGQ